MTKEKMYKLNFIQIKNFHASKEAIVKVEDNPQNGSKYLKIIYLIKNLYPECIKDSYKSIIKTSQLKIWTRNLNKTFVQRRYKNSQ